MGQDDFIARAYQRMKQTSSGAPTRRPFRKKSVGERSESNHDGWQPPPGVARSRGVMWNNPRRLGDVIGLVAGDRGWQEPLNLGAVVARWPQIVGAQVAQHCEVEAFDQGKLVVRADSTAWAKQLKLLTPQIQNRIAEVIGGAEIPQIIVVGPQIPSWKHGVFTVKGRGPRDTYG